ncbi:MAG: GTP-binding protein [Acidobacteriota bacterium]
MTDCSVSKPWIAVVGGFLGAGKTTLILAAAQELERRGVRSAVILNDQGNELVDTGYATHSGMQSAEVTGGCFCCKLSDLLRVMADLRAHDPDVIFAEPVGSCTDISATILHPLLEYRDEFRLAPFTVLVDPERAAALLAPEADPDLHFLFQKQIEEADLVCWTKSDLYPECPQVSAQHVRQLSARTGQGVAAWLDEIFSGNLTPGREILNIDYEQYAHAEASLAWLNLNVTIEPGVPTSPAVILGPLLDHLDRELTANHVTIVHLKAIIDSATGFLKAAVCANGQEPTVEGALDASPATMHELLLNLRAVGLAQQVRDIVVRTLERIDGKLTGLHLDCFHPGAPRPERRIPRRAASMTL